MGGVYRPVLLVQVLNWAHKEMLKTGNNTNINGLFYLKMDL